MSTPGIKQVAALAGVSVGTVSNVLNRPGMVRDDTRRRVEEAIAELGFVRNESARHLRAGVSRTIAYLATDTANPFFSDIGTGVEQEARDLGVGVFLCNSSGDHRREQQYLELLLEQRVRGVLITPVGHQIDHLLALPEAGVPVVLVDRVGSGAERWCSVSVDDVEGGHLAVSHLLELGHERVAFVGGPLMTVQVRDRLDGARRALAEAGLDAHVDGECLSLLQTADLDIDEGCRAAERLVGLPGRRRPTAAFCGNDLVALGLLQELTRQGVRVPEDVAIVGYDDIDFAAAAAVPLTSVRQPSQVLGRRATQLLLEEDRALRSGDDHVHQQIEFRPQLVVRSSTRPGRS